MDCTSGGIISTSPWTDIVPIAGSFNIDFWVSIGSFNNDKLLISLVSQSSDYTPLLVSITSGSNWRVAFRQSASSSLTNYNTASALNYIGNGYHHVKFERVGTNAIFEVDDVIIYTITDFPATMPVPVQGACFTIGDISLSSGAVYIDNFKIY